MIATQKQRSLLRSIVKLQLEMENIETVKCNNASSKIQNVFLNELKLKRSLKNEMTDLEFRASLTEEEYEKEMNLCAELVPKHTISEEPKSDRPTLPLLSDYTSIRTQGYISRCVQSEPDSNLTCEVKPKAKIATDSGKFLKQIQEFNQVMLQVTEKHENPTDKLYQICKISGKIANFALKVTQNLQNLLELHKNPLFLKKEVVKIRKLLNLLREIHGVMTERTEILLKVRNSREISKYVIKYVAVQNRKIMDAIQMEQTLLADIARKVKC